MCNADEAFDAFKQVFEQDPQLDLQQYFAEHGIEDEDLRLRIEDHVFLVGALAGGMGGRSSKSGREGSAGPVPETLAGHRVIRRLGSGGMGTVYLVEQQEPVHRICALKVIRSGVEDREILKRFDAERQAISQMEHKNIARLYGAGITDQGQPYFVMEYVEGPPITDFVDDRGLGLEERISLFQDLCHGVQHAHRKGILHRDLKPSNVLVCEEDGRPTVKIIDFGLARALDREPLAQSLVTLAGQVIGTPGYMSPEQAGIANTDIDARTDVYSLGAILYELLCGRPPLCVDKSHPMWLGDLQRRLKEEEPPRPSSRLTTQAQDGEDTLPPPQLRTAEWKNRIRGDLDWITLKAIDKDRDRRYHWPSDLAEDLDTYLRHEPILAAPPGARRTIRKFIRRNRIAIASLMGVFLLLLGLLTTALSLRFAHARTVGPQAALLAFGLHNVSVEHYPRAESAFQRLLNEAPDSQFAHLALLGNAGILYRAGWPRYASRTLADVEEELSSLPHELPKGTLPGYAGWAHALERKPVPQPSWLKDYSKASDPRSYADAEKLCSTLSSATHFKNTPFLGPNREFTDLRDGNGKVYLVYLGALERKSEAPLQLCVLDIQTGSFAQVHTKKQLRRIRFPSARSPADEAGFLAVYSEGETGGDTRGFYLGYFQLDLKSSSARLVDPPKAIAISTEPYNIFSWRNPRRENEVQIALQHLRHWSYHVLKTPEDGPEDGLALWSPASNMKDLSNDSLGRILLAGRFRDEDRLDIFIGFSEWSSYSVYLIHQQEEGHDFEIISEQLFGANHLACAVPSSAEGQKDRILINKLQVPTYYHDNVTFFGRFRPGGMDASTVLLDFDAQTAEFRVLAREPIAEIHRLFRTPLTLATGDVDGDGELECLQLLATTLPNRPHPEYASESARCVQILRIPSQGIRFKTLLLASCDADYMKTANLDADQADELILFSPSPDSDMGIISIYGYESKQ